MNPQAGKKTRMLDHIADENGVAVVLLDESGYEVSVSNNNSICRALTASPDFASKCAEYCGAAFEETESGKTYEYKCYAGLNCKAVAVADQGKRFVAIAGRMFTTADDYRKATERAISGDWREFQANEFFENVLLDGSLLPVEKAVAELGKFRTSESPDVLDLDAPQLKLRRREMVAIEPAQPAAQVNSSPVTPPTPSPDEKKGDRLAAPPREALDKRVSDARSLRSFLGRLTDLDYHSACVATLEYLHSTYGLDSLVWFERKNDHFEVVSAMGDLEGSPIKVSIAPENARLIDAGRRRIPLELRERAADGSLGDGRTLNLFASMLGNEMRGAIGVEGSIDPEIANEIMRFAKRIGPQIEILRLRREVADREWLTRATSRFSESLKRIDADDFWSHLTQVSAELVQSERASLLVRSGPSDGLKAKAAVGAKIDLLAEESIGDRVAISVLNSGQPVVVEDINHTRIPSAPSDWLYKSTSFISYPIMIGDRRIGVMNFTDKVGGAPFERRDLELLNAIAPQIAVAIDRTSLKDMAGEFEQLSVTDALTGLLNRRYLEKRLNEEIQRSRRHRFPMSIMLLDVDEFKSYNDTFGHPAGDVALKLVAAVLQDMLRGADVAARYGGEEFAILLPQTTSSEAAVIGERLRQRIERTEFPKRKVTVSIGIASCSNELATPEDIVGAADHALYEAKNHGRNNVQIYDGYGRSFNDKIN